MNATIDHAGKSPVGRLGALSLTAIALLAIQLATAFPPRRCDVLPGADRDYVLYFQAHQLFRRSPEELNEGELNDLKRWCRCLQLTTKHDVSGAQSLNDEECRFVVQVLDDVCPDSDLFAAYRWIHESCRQSLDRRPATIASNRELPSHDQPLLLE